MKTAERMTFSTNGPISYQFIQQEILDFISSYSGKCYETKYIVLSTKISPIEIFQKIFDILNKFGFSDFKRTYLGDHSVIIYENFCLLIEIGNFQNLWEHRKTRILFHAYGNENILQPIMKLVSEEIITDIANPIVTWQFANGSHIGSKNIDIEPPKKIIDELYPWIADGIDQYLEDYIESDSNVLLLLGEPGTGKSTLINSFIWRYNLNTTFTYDEYLLENDSIFVNFITHDQQKLMVIEDADTMLSNRELGNKIMRKFLNISDGLAKGVGKKKLIFTANIQEANKVDSALLRVGRCFDFQTFRRLTIEEGRSVVSALDLNITVDKPLTVAELFGMTKKQRKREINRVGFKFNET